MFVFQEDETSPKEAETKTTPDQTKPLLSFKSPEGHSELGKINPIVLLKPVVARRGGYRCEFCNRTFTTVSQLVKHRKLHEEHTCGICGKCFTSHTDLTKHHCLHTIEPSFPCNMCDRSFATNHHLKRHKLRHVKDGRKCLQCGVLFCQRHKHVLYLPQAETKVESEDESFITEPQNAGSDLVQKNTRLDELKPNKAIQTLDNSQSSQTPQKTSSLLTVAVLSNNFKVPPPTSLTRISSKFPVPMLPDTSPMPCPPSPKVRYSRIPGTTFQLKPVPDYPATFVQPHLPQYPELPPSLMIFSPQVLTSALLEVKRNYEYILKNPHSVDQPIKIENIVKEEPCELPMSSPEEQSIEQGASGRIAYDLEIEI